MAENIGIAPPELDTPVGEFRVLYGDTAFEELDPPQPGLGNYTNLSDAEIKVYLKQGRDNPKRALGYLMLSLSAEAAAKSKTVKDYDLMVDLTRRSGDYRRLAEQWFGLADEDDTSTGSDDIFDSFGIDNGPVPHPEASPYLTARWY